ncbi:MAG: ribonuclease E inhibitor RraB [Pseudomonadota bacterium]|nr:ribonuclease E inhibitor RraB [Pseudomonadota bacterium]
MISREALVEMFAGIAKDARWDMSKPMLWGYFFTDTDKTRLESVAPLLQEQGYRLVEIFLSEKQSADEPDLWWLHVEKEEIHTPDSLNERNHLLYSFADDHKLGSYDGMDVGPAQVKR